MSASCLSFSLSVCLFFYLSVCLYVSVCLFFCLSVCLSHYSSLTPSVSLFVCMSFSPSLYLPILPLSLSIFLYLKSRPSRVTSYLAVLCRLGEAESRAESMSRDGSHISQVYTGQVYSFPLMVFPPEETEEQVLIGYVGTHYCLFTKWADITVSLLCGQTLLSLYYVGRHSCLFTMWADIAVSLLCGQT